MISKGKIILFLTLCALGFVVSDNAGIKLAVQSKLASQLNMIDLSKVQLNTELIKRPGIDVVNSSVLSVKINELKLIKMKTPVFDFIIENNGKIKISMRNIIANFIVSISSSLKDFENVPAEIGIIEVLGEVKFEENKVSLSSFDIRIGKIDLDLNNAAFNLIFKAIQGFIKTKIEEKRLIIKEAVERALNGFFKGEAIINLNEFKSKLDISVSDFPKLEKVGPKNHMLTFGAKGSFSMDDKQTTLVNSKQMNFPESAKDYAVNVLISEFTINSLIEVYKESDKLKIVMKTDSEKIKLPFVLDTDILGKLFPEIKQKYSSPKKVEIVVNIPKSLALTPLINISQEGVKGSAQLYVSFFVIDCPEGVKYDNPIDMYNDARCRTKIYDSYNECDGELSFRVNGSIISADVKNINIKKVDILSQDILKIDNSNITNRVSKFLNEILSSLPLLQGFDLNDLLGKFIGSKDTIESAIVKHFDGFMHLAINLKGKK